MTKLMLFKLFNGDMILGEHVGTSQPSDIGAMYEIDNPRMLVIAPTMTGGAQVMLTSVCAPLRSERLKKRISIPAAQVMFMFEESEIDIELVNGYKSEVSGIKIASASDMVALNSAPKPGSFTL